MHALYAHILQAICRLIETDFACAEIFWQDPCQSAVSSEVAGEEVAVHLRARAQRHNTAGIHETYDSCIIVQHK
jgi:hypothetical protein